VKRLPLAVASLVIIALSFPWWNAIPPLGDDASGHIVLFARFAEMLMTGAGSWAPDYNLGFPIGLYYQPLPHTVGGGLTALLGGGTAAIAVYKLVTVALLAAQPWAVAFGARRLGLDRSTAVVAGLSAPLISSSLGYGLTVESTLVFGLHSQAWAGVLLPLAAGELARALGSRDATGWAVLTWTLLFLAHFFYGIALGAIAFLWVFAAPREAPGRLARLSLTALLTAAALAFWLVPLVGALNGGGGWPFGGAERVNGYGFSFIASLVSGQLLDGGGLPLLTLAAGVGVFAAAARWGGSRGARLAVMVAAIGLVGSIGRAGFGPLIDLFPPNRALQLFRYVGIVHFAGALLIGLGVSALLSLAGEERRRRIVVTCLIGALAGVPVARAVGVIRGGFRTIDAAGVDLDAYADLTAAMARETATHGAGRVFAFPYTGLSGHFYSGLLGLWDASDMGDSRGVGLHDSLGYYFLEYLHPERQSHSDLVPLFGFQYLAGDAQRTFEHLGAEAVFTSPEYTYWRLNSRVSMCSAVHVLAEPPTDPRSVRAEARRWLRGNGPSVGVHPVRRPDVGFSMSLATGAPESDEGVRVVETPSEPVGRVLLDQRAPDRLVCALDMAQPGAALFRMGYHPYWRAHVDGRPAAVELAYPSFAAVRLEAGESEVVLRYSLPRYARWLRASAPIPVGLAFAIAGLRRSRRRNPHSCM